VPGDQQTVRGARRRDAVRDPLADPRALAAARRRSMSERLELALSWNAVTAELRAGLAAEVGRGTTSR